MVRSETLETRALLSAGDLDPAFGNGGQVLTDIDGLNTSADFGRDVVVDSQGRVLVAGNRGIGNEFPRPSEAIVTRYLPNGSLDTSFGLDGVVALSHSTLSSIPVFAGDPGASIANHAIYSVLAFSLPPTTAAASGCWAA